MRATRAIGWVLAMVMGLSSIVPAEDQRPDGVELGARVTVREGNAAQIAVARWAASRFEAAGLELPPLAIRFHADPTGCGDHLGLYRAGVVDVCGTNVNLMSRRNLLHEMAHAWAEVNVTGQTRERFLAIRGLTTWNGWDVGWRERGFEHAAEILAWYLGDRILTPTVPDNAPDQLTAAVTVLAA